MDLNLMDQEDPNPIKKKSIRLIRILDENNEKSDLEQEVNNLIQLTKFQQVILLSCIRRYKYLFDGNLGEWTGTPVYIPLKD